MALYIGNKKYCAVVNANVNNQDKIITANGNYVPEEGYSGFGVVRVQVPEPVFEEKTITPTTQEQTFTPSVGVDGFSSITIQPVTNTIDEDIKAENIKKGIDILGVTGTLEFTTEELTIAPTTAQQIKTPTVDGYSKVTIDAVTNEIDSNIQPENIKKDVTILGITGTCVESVTTTRTITSNGVFTPPEGYTGFSSVTVEKIPTEDITIDPTTEEQTFTSTEYEGYGTVTVNPVTAAIDSDIIAENIKTGIEILGVTGTLEPLSGETKTITANGTYTPSSGYNGFTSVTVEVDTVNNQELTINQNGTYTPDEGYTGFSSVTVDINTVNNQELTVTTNGTYTPEDGYTGFSTVVVNVETVNNQDITLNANGTYTPDVGYTGFGTVTVDVIIANNQDITITDEGIYTPDEGYTGFGTVTVDLTWIKEQLEALNAGDSSTGSSGDVSLQDITLTQAGTYVCDGAYDGFGTVTVDLDWVDTKINAIRAEQVSTSVDAFLDDTAENIVTDATIIRSYACYYQTALNQAVLNNCTTINEYAFANSSLQKLIINTQTVCTLTSSTAFEGTVIASGTGSIYVPDNLVDTYKEATNWNLYADQIVGVSTL